MEYMVRKMTGRYMHLDKPALEMMRMEFKKLLEEWGASEMDDHEIFVEDDMPLWAEVEFLDNIIQFELECNPYLYGEIKN